MTLDPALAGYTGIAVPSAALKALDSVRLICDVIANPEAKLLQVISRYNFLKELILNACI